MSAFELILLIGCAALTVAAHWLLQLADRRSRAQYEAMLQALGRESIDAVWLAGRPLVGLWGCALILFQFLRGLGIVGILVGLVVALIAG